MLNQHEVWQCHIAHAVQYQPLHFCESDETGIANRYAGFFSTQRTGLDTLYYVGDELLSVTLHQKNWTVP
jgi:hypothetical protein